MTIKGTLLLSVPIVKRFFGTAHAQYSFLLSVPIVKPFRPKIFPPKLVPKMAFFCENGGLNINFYFQNPQKAHPCVGPRLLTILREDQFWGLGCSLFEEPKKRNNSGT